MWLGISSLCLETKMLFLSEEFAGGEGFTDAVDGVLG